MKLISHRGNIDGKRPKEENSIPYIQNALKLGYDVEIDIWKIDKKWYLGHDKPQYECNLKDLIKYRNKIWIHCKNFEALNELNKKNKNLNFFWHETDKFTLTSLGFIWTFPNQQTSKKSIIVDILGINKYKNIYGVCSDNLIKYEKYSINNL